MKSTILLLSLLLCINFSSNGQSEFQDGYVIKSPGDTLFGLIKNQNYYENSLACIYKSKADAPTITYDPKEIFGYRFKEGKFYVSKEITVKKVKVKYFLEYLVNGKLNVYLRQDKFMHNIYYIDKDTLPTAELDYSTTVIAEDSKYYTRVSGNVNGLLRYYTSDCPKVANDALQLKIPTNKNLTDLAKKYHKNMSSNEACIVYEKKSSVSIDFELNGGFHSFDSYGYNSIGTRFYIQNPEISENIYLSLGIMYYFAANPNSNNDQKSSFIQIPVIITYNPNKHMISPIFGVGLSLPSPLVIDAGIKIQLDQMSFRVYGESNVGSLGFIAGLAWNISK